jgi:hypothetical protein
MSARQESKITRLDLRIPNDVYAQVEEIAKANNEPTHHITGNIILTPTLVKLIRLGIRSLSDHYPTLANLATASEQVPDTLTPRMNAVEGELSQLKKLVTELSDKISDRLSDNTIVSDSLSDNVSDIAETETISEDRLGFAYAMRTNNTLDNQELSLSDSQSDTVPDTIDPISTKPIAEHETMSWRDFDRMIGEILPKDIRRNKEEAEKALRLAAERGFNGWLYDAKCKKFIKP